MIEEEQMDRRDGDKWRINKEISLGDVLAIAVAVGSVITAYMSLNARVMVVEAMATQTSNSLNSTVGEIKSDLRRLMDRLERMSEFQYSNGSGLKK